eukprot:15458144-Alexandrium_andersonii.AAC.1
MQPSRASGANVQAVPGPVQLQVRMCNAVFACSMNAGATRFDQFDSLLGLAGARCTRHRVPPCQCS